MEASIVDLRYKTSDILKALERNEIVNILYHGKIKGIIRSANEKCNSNVKEHPFFGMIKDNKNQVLEELDRIRKPRYHV